MGDTSNFPGCENRGLLLFFNAAKMTMCDRGVNSSLGSQWKHRVDDLDDYTKSVPEAARANTKMNVELKRST